MTQERLFKYDALSRLTHERQVEATATLDNGGIKQTSGGLWTGYYKYTSDGLLDYGVEARGVKTDFTYDGLNRVKEVEYTGDPAYTTPKVEYTYSETESGFFNNGRLTKIRTLQVSTAGQTTPETIQNYDYDAVGQVKKHVQTIDTQNYQLEYGYNLAGQLTSEKYPSGKIVTMTVDNFGVTQTIADAQRTYLNGITINDKGQLSQVNLGNGTSESFVFNDRFQIKSQSLKKAAETLQKYDYEYGEIDSNGNVNTLKNNGQLARIESFIGANKQAQQRFEYDSIGRLSQSSEYRGDNNSLTYKQKFDFDRFGNLYRYATSNPTAGQQNPLPYTPIEVADIDKETNRFETDTTYDEAGNVLTDSKFRDMGFAYDANGRQVKATRASVPDAHTVYDALGNRVATKINDVWQYMVYDAFGRLVAEYGAPSEGSGGVKYIQLDNQGSVRTITNSNGFVVSRTDHQAFGEVIDAGIGLRSAAQGYAANAGTRQGYGLTESDQATGQQHTWFRKLETQGGRWTSPDPYKGSISLRDPQSFNRYSYVGNDPANFVDPSGLQMCDASYGWGICGNGFWGGGGGSGYRTKFWDINIGDGHYYRLYADYPTFGGYNPRDRAAGGDCEKLALLVEEIAQSAANAGEFIQKLIDRTIGANISLNAASRDDLEKAQWITGFTFGGDSGFNEKFRDGTGLQVRHFVGGLWVGYLYGAVLGLAAANSNEYRVGAGHRGYPAIVPRDGQEADIALNSVSVALGSRLVPRNPEAIGRGITVPGHPGYKGLAAAIRNQVCD